MRLETSGHPGGTDRVPVSQAGHGGQVPLALGEGVQDPAVDAHGLVLLEDAVSAQLGQPDVEELVALGLTEGNH